jgi:hypothetical protein
MDQLNPNIHVENYRDPNDIQAEIERVVEILTRQPPVIRTQFHQLFRQPNSNISMTADSGADHSIIVINRQTLRNYFDRILTDLSMRNNQIRQRHRAGERILAPEWWYSTNLTNPEQ